LPFSHSPTPHSAAKLEPYAEVLKFLLFSQLPTDPVEPAYEAIMDVFLGHFPGLTGTVDCLLLLLLLLWCCDSVCANEAIMNVFLGHFLGLTGIPSFSLSIQFGSLAFALASLILNFLTLSLLYTSLAPLFTPHFHFSYLIFTDSSNANAPKLNLAAEESLIAFSLDGKTAFHKTDAIEMQKVRVENSRHHKS
jgi:hypothetical protein